MALSENMIDAIVMLFKAENPNSPDTTIEAQDLSKFLKKEFDYQNPHRVIRDAIREGFLYVDDITDKMEFMLGLTEWGEEVWGLWQFSEEEEDDE